MPRTCQLVALVASACVGCAAGWGAELQLATDAPRPLAPEESAKRFQLPKGFQIELVAAEPLVADPVAMAFDARGRIFVCEIHGYNLEGYLDVLELNKTGVLDKAVRRIPAAKEAQQKAAQEQYGTVKLLEDADGDGRMDRVTVWADRLAPAYGLVPARHGVIVLCAPDILYLADRDDDGKPEVRQTLFSGFGRYELWSRINNPRWGLDNWIYAASGIESGGTIRGPALAGPVHLPATAFRFTSDGSALEPATGSTSGFGLAMNDWGDRFLVTNQQHVLLVAPLAHRYLARNPYYAAPNPVVNISTYGHPAQVFPTSQPDPWRLVRGKDPAWLKFYGEAEATPNGFFTAASGQAIYQADQFPEDYRGNHFSVDNAQNLVHRCLLEPDGVLWKARRPTPDEQSEFLTSTEQWFRPVNLSIGPDGSLYVVDMYRAIIEDYSAIPRYLQQLYIESLIAGADKGRIWRVKAEGAAPPQPFDLSRADSPELVRQLTSANAWWRQTAQRLLVERGDQTVRPLLLALAREGTSPQARLHAMYTLDGLGVLEPQLVEHALADPHFAVRAHALVLSERWLDQRPTLADKALALLDDPEPRVRLQLALSLGESKGARAVGALAQLAVRHGADRWMQAAILSSVPDAADRLLADVLRRGGAAAQSGALVPALAAIVGARHQSREIGAVLAALAEVRDTQPVGLQVECLQGLIQGLKRGKAQVMASAAGQAGLRRLMRSPAPQVQELALQVAGLVRLEEAPEMKAALASASKTALDGTRSLDERLAAVAVLTGAAYADVAPAVKGLLDPRQPLDLQLAAVRVAASTDDPQVAAALLAHWQSITPNVQAAVIEAIFGRQNRLPALLDALARNAVPISGLDQLRRVQLLENPDPAIRQRAESVLGGQTVAKDREKVVAQYVAAIAAPRDAKRGKQIFDKQCAKCHQVKGEGFVVGPDLSVITRKSDEMLVSDVMDPNNQITVGYNQYTVITEDGKIFTGILAAETATSVTLRKEQAADEVILRKDIDVMSTASNSMMPEDLEKEVSPKDVADLIAYLREAFGPAAPPLVTLFDDDPAFASLLAEGEGRAAVVSGDRFSGTAALGITPPQRFSLRIPGWQYRIVENPGPGEYRYLRFAWKSRGGHGIMIELAGEGKWPPADRPLWRYYSGKNTTGWAAVEVTPDVPQQWTVVTRDLWKDFGNFTLTGIAPTAMGGEALFDRIELLRSLDSVKPGQ